MKPLKVRSAVARQAWDRKAGPMNTTPKAQRTRAAAKRSAIKEQT